MDTSKKCSYSMTNIVLAKYQNHHGKALCCRKCGKVIMKDDVVTVTSSSTYHESCFEALFIE